MAGHAGGPHTGVMALPLPRIPDVVTDRLAALRSRAGSAVFSRVAGDEGSGRRARILGTDGPRWFADDAPIRRVHGDSSMFVGGLRALLLQSLHPLAMAGVAGHSGFRGDPWGRLQRTSYFLAATTFGPADEAQRVIERIRHAHSFVRGTAPDGRTYSASDPHLLRWVHVAEIDSFLAAHDRYGRDPRARRRGPAGDHGGAGRADRRLPAGAARYPGGPRRRPLPAAGAAAAADRAGALRRAGRGVGGAVAALGTGAAAAAVVPGRRGDRGARGRDADHGGDPLGDLRAAAAGPTDAAGAPVTVLSPPRPRHRAG